MECTVEQHYAVKFCFKLRKSASETFELIKQTYGDDALSRTRVLGSTKRLRQVGSSLKYCIRRPTTTRTDAQVATWPFLVSANEKGAQRTLVQLYWGSSNGNNKGSQQYSATDLQQAFDEWQTHRTKCRRNVFWWLLSNCNDTCNKFWFLEPVPILIEQTL